MTEYPQRKPNRLKGFDYSTPRAYFVTFCTQDRRCILSTIVGASMARPPCLTLTEHGRTIDAAIQSIPHHYPLVQVDKYVIMPNHVHMILILGIDVEDGRAMLAPTTPSLSVSHIIQHLKGVVSKHIGHSIWQKSFHDHVIRSEEDYRTIWEYIDTNPYRWQEDCFWQP